MIERPERVKILFLYFFGLNLLWSQAAVITPGLHHSSISDALSIEDNPFQYSSAYTDRESPLQYLNARYYDADIARFISRDTFGEKQKINVFDGRYNYAAGNPVLNKDPSGHKSKISSNTSLYLAVFGFLNASSAFFYSSPSQETYNLAGRLHIFNLIILSSSIMYSIFNDQKPDNQKWVKQFLPIGNNILSLVVIIILIMDPCRPTPPTEEDLQLQNDINLMLVEQQQEEQQDWWEEQRLLEGRGALNAQNA